MKLLNSLLGFGLVLTFAVHSLDSGASGLSNGNSQRSSYWYTAKANCGKPGTIEFVHFGLLVEPDQKIAKVCSSLSDSGCGRSKVGSDWASVSDFSKWTESQDVGGYKMTIKSSASDMLALRPIQFFLSTGKKSCNSTATFQLSN